MIKECAKILQGEVIYKTNTPFLEEALISEEQNISENEPRLGDWSSVEFDIQSIDEDLSFLEDIGYTEPMDVDEQGKELKATINN
ncbi:hypothetical protein A0J61_02991 [Choanephora cucurbitarum]|uniref:Uncharacterized protein n=1 Tax=Choanephora cucurbitarum TaxID=101091 RepID=A0A1C7NIQ4_9FUNG|nr:hypothetical protein A0J61_02991 [Choanephora cucurbitarum]